MDTIIGGVVLVGLAVIAALVLLSPGIIINGLRGRYKNSPHNLLRSAVNDWQTWLISLPFVVTAFILLRSDQDSQQLPTGTNTPSSSLVGSNEPYAAKHAQATPTPVSKQTVTSDETTSNASGEIPRAIPIAKPARPAASPTQPAPPIAKRISYSVADVTVLLVRAGPGPDYDITQKLPNGYGNIYVIGPPVVTGVTEWVQITFGNQSGWVNKERLKAERTKR